ncbi:MAG TPA: superoxide dismutase family protein [Planctomycetes bacterium]|nr:superoxide dismutase family protein [Planctomycetota bacterium]
MSPDGHGPVATASVQGKSGSSLSGTATFVQRDGGVLVTLTVENAPPGRHAVHLHEKGDCSSPDGKSAGGHWNPDTMQHGSPFAEMHHAGDLGNMEVGSDGRGTHVLFLPGLTVRPGTHGVIGHAIVIHAGADDLTSQPTGAAGGRIGCGVIQ